MFSFHDFFFVIWMGSRYKPILEWRSSFFFLNVCTVNMLVLKAELLNEHGKNLFLAILWELTSNVISDVEEH